jgi:hypothetical protein
MDSETLLLTALILGGGYFLYTELEKQRQQTASWEENLGKELGGVFTNFKNELAPIFSTISSDLSSVENTLSTGFINFENSAKQEFNSISNTLAGLGESAKQDFNTVETYLSSSVSQKVQQTENFFENVGSEISKGWNSFINLF